MGPTKASTVCSMNNFLETAKDSFVKLIQEGYDKDYLCKEEYEALEPSNMGVARFYHIFKVHKFHPSIPARPIISGNSSFSLRGSLSSVTNKETQI